VIAGPKRAGSGTPCRCRASRWAHDHNIELIPGKGRPDRSVGRAARPSSWPRRRLRHRAAAVRRDASRAAALRGDDRQVSNLDHENQSLGKAGRARHMAFDRRPGRRDDPVTIRTAAARASPRRACRPKTPWGSRRWLPDAARDEGGSPDRPVAAPQVVGGDEACRVRSRKAVRRGAAPRPRPGDEQENERKIVRTWSRASVVFPDFIGHTIAVYNGPSTCRLCHREHGRSPVGRVRPDRTFRGHDKKTDRSTAVR